MRRMVGNLTTNFELSCIYWQILRGDRESNDVFVSRVTEVINMKRVINWIADDSVS